MSGTVRQDRDGAIVTVTLSNPDKLNAIDAAMWRQLEECFSALDQAADVRCIILTGEGKAFAAGGDLAEFRDARADIDSALSYHEQVGRALDAIAVCRHPVVARISGPCVGGGLEIAAACDLRIAGESAKFGAPINKLGFSMYPGEMAGLLKLAGPAVVKEVLLEGRLLSAGEAYDKGLLTRVVADATLDEEIAATAQRIVSGAPLIAGWHKLWIARLLNGRPLTDAEKRASFAFLATADYQEGLTAFLEKRPPRFTGQ